MKLKNYNKRAGVIDGTFWLIVGAIWAVHAAFAIGYALVPSKPTISPQGHNIQAWGQALHDAKR